MTEKPRVSVIIPHLNTPELLVRVIHSVANQRIDHGRIEIIIADNGSRVSLAAVRAAWPEVRFVVEPTPGPGPARNLGISVAGADILAFIDADMKAEPGWLQAGLDALAEDDSGPLGGDVLIDTGGRSRLTPVEAFECEFAYRMEHYVKREHYSGAGNLMMTRAVFDAAGPFGGINTAEDMMFGQRAHDMGMVTRYVPAMRALHPARPDIDEMLHKWKRLSVQKLSAHQAAGRPLWKWRARALAVAVSGIAHAPRMLCSRRVPGMVNRLRGLGALLRIRWGRAMDMLELARDASAGRVATAMNWNR